MHPGPVNRGVELSPEVIDGPASLITAQVESGPGGPDGGPLRAARRRAATRAASGEARAARADADRRARVTRSATTRPVSALDWRGTEARRPATLVIRGARVLDPLEGVDDHLDVVVRDGRDRRARPAGIGRRRRRRADRRRGPDPLPGLLRPARPPAHPGPRGQGGRRDRVPRRRRRRLLRDRRDGEHRPAGRHGRRRRRRCASRRASRPRCRSGFVGTVTKGMAGAELTEMAELAAAGRGRLLRRRAADPQRARDAPGAPVPAPRRPADRAARGGPGALGRRLDARGRGLGGARDRRRPLGLGVDDDRPRLRPGRLRGGPDPRPAPLGRRVGGRGRAARRPTGIAVTCEATPHHLDAHRRGGQQPRLALQDEPAAAHRGRPPGADRGVRSGADRLHRDRPRAAHLRREGGRRSSRRRWASPGSRPRSPSLYTELVLPGRPRARHAASSGWAAAPSRSASTGPRIATGAEANLTLCDLDAEWEAGAEGWESRSENSCFAGRRLRGRVLITVAGGRVAYRQRVLRAGGRVKLDPERATPGRDRRPGGVPQGAADLRRGRPRVRRRWSTAPPRSGSRSSSPSSTRRDSERPSPRSPTICRRASSGSTRSASRPPRPTASTSASATRRSSAGSRPTSA